MMDLVLAVQEHLRENHLIELTHYQLGEFVGHMQSATEQAGCRLTTDHILAGLFQDVGLSELKEFTEEYDPLLREVRDQMMQ